MKKKTIAFICVHNSCRSIMAEGFANHLGSDIVEVYSAGTEEYDAPKPMAIEVMTDLGIDMSYSKSKLISELPPIDIVITMGCNVSCPTLKSEHREDWGLEDPSGKGKDEFKHTRDLINFRVVELLNSIRNNEI